MRNLLDRALGKYVILEEIGRGGMAAVYKARDVELDRIVAMKVLSPYLVGEPRLVQRFMGEARLAANLDHPNIVTIYDIGGEGGYYYFVMKYLEGRSLKEILAERGPLPPDEVLDLLRQLASALDYAHGQNLIHRDIKPGNIIIGDGGHATLTDFGLAKVAENLKLTASGETIGTLEYMAPEQARGDAEERSDIYSLAVITYEMLVGRLPFQGNNQASLLYQHLHDPPPPLRQWNPGVPLEVEEVVLKAMAKDPAERYATAGEMARELEQAAKKAVFSLPARRTPAREVVERRPPGLVIGGGVARLRRPRWLVLPALPPFLERWWWALAGGGLLLILTIVLLVVLLGRGGGPLAVLPTAAAPTTPLTTPAAAVVPSTDQPLVPPGQMAFLPRVLKTALVELAMLCDLYDEETMGRLAFWRPGQEEPSFLAALPDEPVVSQMSWSPDGKALVFVLIQEGRPNVFRVQRDGTGLVQLTDTSEGKEDPVWSPDGLQIAFADGPQGNRGIFLVPAEGGDLRNVTPGPSDDWAPSWSPDSRFLAFVSDRDGNSEIYILDLVSEQVQRLTEDPGDDVYPVWTPDGEDIVFLSDRTGSFYLYTMGRSGQEVRLLFDRALWLERPAWSPDGELLVITRPSEEAQHQVFFLDVTSGGLTPGPAGCRRPAWRPQ